MSSKPTFIFVPGAWHSPSTWDKVATLLEAQGYKCVRPALPSAKGDPSATFLDDLTVFRNAISAETSQGHNVVVVVHSYGGIVGASAIKGFTPSKKTDSSATPQDSTTGHVIGLAMMATGFAMTGVSFMDGGGGKPPPSWKVDEETGFATLVTDPRQLFYHDLPIAEADYWVSKLENQALKALFEGGEHVYAGWQDVPVWFLATKDDQALPVEVQRMLVQMARDGGGDVTLREVESSHSPMLSRPEETAEFLLDAAKAFVGEDGQGKE